MQKTHLRVTLDVYVIADSGIHTADRLRQCGFIVDPDQDATDDVMDIQDITVEDVIVTDAR